MKSTELLAVVVRSSRWGAALGLLLGCSAHAEGFRNPPEGGASMGRVGGNIAMNDDASAVARNPANLVLMTNAQVQVGANIVHPEIEFTSALTGATDKTKDPWKFLPYAFAAMPLKDNQLALGLGVSFPFGQSTVWSQEGQFRYTAPYFAELRVMNVNPVLSAKVGDQLCLAVGADIYASDIEMRQYISWANVTGAPVPDGVERLEGSGLGLGGNAAATWLITDKQRLALTYRSPVKVNYDGYMRVSNIPLGIPALARSDFSTDITFPGSAGLGYSIQCCEKLKVEADVEWVEFSRYEDLTLDADGNNPLLHPAGDPVPPVAPKTIPQAWKDAWTAGVGAEYQLCSAAVLRLGYQFIESPIPENTMAPTLPDDDRHVVSVGLGLKHGAHALDVAFMQSFFRKRTISTQAMPFYNGTYDINSQIIAASYNYSF